MDMVERCRARHVIGGVLSRVREGAGGRAVLVTGAPGMGKTSLIRHAQELAEESGAIVMTAVASPAERDLPLGVVSQLLATASLPPGQAGELAEFAEFTEFIEGPAPVMAKAADSLYRHLALLARRAPVVLTVDDAQDIDAASLQCLQHLMRRVGALRVLVVLGERAGGGRQGSSALTADCLCNPECTLIRLSPLCAECTESLIAEHLGDDRAAHAAPALRRASGGSPLLLQALLWDRSAERLAEDGTPAGGELFRLAVQYVLDQLGPDELRVARALAVLGASATHDFLDRVLRLRTALAMSALDAVGLTEAGRYRTEEARTTVLEGVTPEERAALHRTAARVLHESGAAAGQVARHLVCAGPCADPWAIPVLREAAAQALADHDAEGAVTCLRRAYDTSTSAPQRAVIRVELTRAEWETDPGAVRRHLTELLDDHANGYLSCGQSMTLITYLLWLGRPEEAATLFADLDGVRDELSGEIRVRLDTMHVWFAYFYPVLGAHEHAAAPAEATGIGGVMAVDPHSDGALVLSSLLSGGPTSGALDAAERLLESVVLHDPPVAPAMAALVSLIRAARLDRAAEWCELLVRGAGPRTPQARAIFAAASATVESWLGNFEVARQRADEALTLIPPQAWGVALGLPLSAKVLACAELGDIEASAECFRVPVPPVMFQTLPGLHYLQARGRHHLSVGRYQAALGDFYACRDLMAAWKLDVSVFTAWRVYAAEALIEVDSPGRARELLTAELAEPDPGSSWLRSRAVALFERVNSHVPEPTETPSARTPLRAPAGIPKQPLTPSPGPERGTAEGLTRAEQRVALMASDGLTNRDIAERLFITPSTVEQHLTRIYHKLGVRGRRALPQALADRTVIRP